MSMTAAGRGQAIYNQVAKTSPGFAKLTSAEQAQTLASLTAIFGAGDLAYITANAQVNPGTLADPGGATVATSGSAVAQSGTVTSAVGITGLGTVS